MRPSDGFLVFPFVSPAMTCVLATVLAALALAAHGEEHPIYTTVDPAKAADYEAAVERVMAMSEEEMLSLLPDRNRISFCECPNCYGGSQGSNIFTWNIDRPEELTCRHCSTVIRLPDARYPEAHVLAGENALGEQVEYPYYLNEEKDVQHFLSGHLLTYKRGWIASQCVALGVAFKATNRPEYARRV